jgi:hypothetical protein
MLITRTKENIREIRHIYLDLDESATASLEAIRTSGDIPAPDFVLDTSPEKNQVIGRVEGLDQDQTESLLRSLAIAFQGDPAATDISRLLRVARIRQPQVQRVVSRARNSGNGPDLSPSDFAAYEDSPHAPRRPGEHSGLTRRMPLGHRSQSEADWAYAKRALARGDSPDEVIRRVADYRAEDTSKRAIPNAWKLFPQISTPKEEYPLTVREAAKYLGVSPQTVYLWVSVRRFPISALWVATSGFSNRISKHFALASNRRWRMPRARKYDGVVYRRTGTEGYSHHHGDRVADLQGTDSYEEGPSGPAKCGRLDTGFKDTEWYRRGSSHFARHRSVPESDGNFRRRGVSFSEQSESEWAPNGAQGGNRRANEMAPAAADALMAAPMCTVTVQ